MQLLFFANMLEVLKIDVALPGFLGNRGGGKGIYFRGTGQQSPNVQGNSGTMTIFGNREHKKTNFRFRGNRGTSQLFQGNRYRPAPGNALLTQESRSDEQNYILRDSRVMSIFTC